MSGATFTNIDPQVDTDGDGIDDSIWIDIGLPVQTDIDGRRYKPLVAYQVVDMDGKLNVNALSSLYDIDQEDTTGDGDADSSDGLVNRATIDSGERLVGGVDPLNHDAFITGTAPQQLMRSIPQGQYLGTPEISLWSLFERNPASAASTPNLFEENQAYFNLVSSRYGADSLPGTANGRDLWNQYEQFGHPDPTYPNSFVGGHFGTSMDIHGRYTAGIANAYVNNLPFGLATRIEDTDLIALREVSDSGYEFTLMPNSRFATDVADISDDQPYTAKELERILRKFDRDSRMLPSRLLETFRTLDGDLLLDDNERMALTTHSF